jgi:hypothetical protein
MTLLGWAVTTLVVATLTLGFGGVLFDVAQRLVLFGGEILLRVAPVIRS